MDVYTSSLATLLALLGVGAIQLLLRCLRRSSQLPPGPVPLPVIGNLHLLGKLPHKSLQRLATKYGPIMSLRLGSVPAIVVSSPEAAELFLKSHDRAFAGRPKTQAAKGIFYRATGGVAFTSYGPHQQIARRVCVSQLLSPSRVRLFGPTRKEELGRVVDEIRKAATARDWVDLTAVVERLMGELNGKFIVGSNIKARSALKAIIREVVGLISANNLADYVSFLGPLDLQGISRGAKVLHMRIDNVLEEIIDEHRGDAASKGLGDLVDVLLSALDHPTEHDDNKLQVDGTDRTNLKAVLLDIITAAEESTSSVVDWAFSELLRNPSIMARLQGELNTVVGTDRAVEEEDLINLKYLEMVVKETLRLHPIGPLLLPHECLEDTVVSGYRIPKNSRIIVNAAAIGRDPSAWSSNADEFIPERFIDQDVALKGHDFRLIPFGAGRRSCPGSFLALTTVNLVLAQLVHCFDWELPRGMLPSDLDMTETYRVIASRANHLVLKPTYRLLV